MPLIASAGPWAKSEWFNLSRRTVPTSRSQALVTIADCTSTGRRETTFPPGCGICFQTARTRDSIWKVTHVRPLA
jgi:hypothetical protein